MPLISFASFGVLPPFSRAAYVQSDTWLNFFVSIFSPKYFSFFPAPKLKQFWFPKDVRFLNFESLNTSEKRFTDHW